MGQKNGPQRLKPGALCEVNGTAEAVPLQTQQRRSALHDWRILPAKRTPERIYGKYKGDRRHVGTEEAKTRGTQEGRPQSEAHDTARLAEEKGEKAGTRPKQALERV